MNKILTIILLILYAVSFSYAQENENAPTVKEKDKPVRSPWSGGHLIDGQTSVVPVKNTLEFVIQHKFGTVSNGISDLLGLYAPGTNIRLGLSFVPYKNLQLGWGITKKNMYNDFSAKWTVLEQTRKNTIPVSVTLYGNFAVDGRSSDYFRSQSYYHSSDPVAPLTKHPYRTSERYSYFSQLIIGRKITEKLSLQAGASFTHYNLVVKTGDHDKIALHAGGRFKFSPQSSVILNTDFPLKIKNISEQREWTDPPKPNLACGLEIATTSHVFQIYMGTASGILPQDDIMYNLNDWKNKGFAFGFVITRLWNF